jgi:hypothetical protein
VVPRDPADPASGHALLGTYNPTADDFTPPLAGDADAAFAAIALAEASRSQALPEPTRRAARDACVRLAATQNAAAAAPTITAMRALALRIADDGTNPSVGEARAQADAFLRASAPSDPASLTPETEAIDIALAAHAQAEDERANARARLDALLAREDLPARSLADALPWIALAQRSLAVAPAGDSSAAVSRLCDALLATEPADPAPDLAGGLALSANSPLADAQCLRFLAPIIALGHGGADRARSAGRFLIQHVASEPWSDGFRNAPRLKGLVRASLWSDDCPPAATAAGLLVALRAAESLESAPRADRSRPSAAEAEAPRP